MNTAIYRRRLVWLVTICTIAFSAGSKAWDFLYTEDTVEFAKLVSVTPNQERTAGTLILEHDILDAPTSLPYSSNTVVNTPFASSRPVSELSQWAGHPVMVYYALPVHEATSITIYPLSQFDQQEQDL